MSIFERQNDAPLKKHMYSAGVVLHPYLLITATSQGRKWGYWWEVTSMKMSSHWLAEMRDIPNFENTSFIVTFWLAYVWDNPAS